MEQQASGLQNHSLPKRSGSREREEDPLETVTHLEAIGSRERPLVSCRRHVDVPTGSHLRLGPSREYHAVSEV